MTSILSSGGAMRKYCFPAHGERPTSRYCDENAVLVLRQGMRRLVSRFIGFDGLVPALAPMRFSQIWRMVVTGGPAGWGESASLERLTCRRGSLRLMSRGFDRCRRVGLGRATSRLA